MPKNIWDILLQEANKGNINSELVKSTFEKGVLGML